MASKVTTVGRGGHKVTFYHPSVGNLHVRTGIDDVSWGYQLNTASFPTYGGEVVQILSCYIDDLSVGGTLLNYSEMERLYSYFVQYLKLASGSGRKELEHPMTFTYDHRGWEFKIIVTELPGYKKARELTAPEWRIKAHIIDTEGDVESLEELIRNEADIQAVIGSSEAQSFGLQGKVRFIDENPFSDPNTNQLNFAQTRSERLKSIGDYYSKLLPAYLDGDFDAIFGGIGSKPAFSPTTPEVAAEAKGIQDVDDDQIDKLVRAQKRATK